MSKRKKESDSVASVNTDNKRIEEYLSLKYEFRFNTIKRYAEFREMETDSSDKWVPVSKYMINTFRRELDGLGIKTSPDNLRIILESSFCEAIDPIKEYFNKLPKWDEKDYIKVLANTVKVVNHDKWNEYLKKWIVGVVANVMIDAYCANHLCLVLTGGQGKFKTTWLDNLCPKALSEHYIFTGKIDPAGKDCLTYIAEYLFVNIDDQLRQLNKQDENQLKNLITTPQVKYRRPYDPGISYYPHTCSFMASVNGNDFLTDPTGNRRFLPFEVLSIDIDEAKKINMDLVYSQALHLFRSKFQYWFNDTEVIDLHENNQRFQVTSQEEELVLEYFSPTTREHATDYLTRTMISTHLEMITKKKLNEKKLSEALVKLGFSKWQKSVAGQVKWVWNVVKKDLSAIENENKNFKPSGVQAYDAYTTASLNVMLQAAITNQKFEEAAKLKHAIDFRRTYGEQTNVF